jgi:hypothetical protein
MSRQAWVEDIADEQGINGTAVASSTTETIIFPDNTIPNGFMRDGRKLRLTAWGKIGATATPAMTWRLRWGGVGGTIIAQSSAITLAAATDVMFAIVIDMTVRINGASGSVLAMGNVTWGPTIKTTNVPDFMGSAGGASTNTPAAVTVALNADTALSITAQWSANSASNTVTGMQYTLEALN